MISSGLCFLAGIPRPFLDPDSHSRWTTQKGAAQLLECAELAAEEAGISNIVLDAWASNSPAQRFFAARGYSPINIVLGKLRNTQ
jgi:N-acetylglutamate synthase-like GNAT family acetyltransferase